MSGAPTGFVLIHRDLGLYVGRTFAQSFWSKLNGAGRQAVATFPSEAQARWHIDLWEGGWPEDQAACGLSLHPVGVDLPDGWASITALRAAGLGEHLGELAHPGWRAATGHC
ncbi:hypothetical protein [Roseomonas marmotae]|uniref:GIY-YIG nuclease family protein n=1 Tax=Roseomonas marmotae TaxID=2768161 RepID=A0ABS3KF03_9PROT|nr:hypothetical protein [Roseomonas marmotae]MBO1076044.1 hypothetical protein [Roseomonas marmotae]QTI81283.1 hypothetical protein IAI58_18170 [Roseomonas marmotae]